MHECEALEKFPSEFTTLKALEESFFTGAKHGRAYKKNLVA